MNITQKVIEIAKEYGYALSPTQTAMLTESVKTAITKHESDPTVTVIDFNLKNIENVVSWTIQITTEQNLFLSE